MGTPLANDGTLMQAQLIQLNRRSAHGESDSQQALQCLWQHVVVLKV